MRGVRSLELLSEKTSNLIQKIELAFADVEHPGDCNLTDSTYGEEPAALTTEFAGKTIWKNLDPEFLDVAPCGWGTALSFFSGEALQFFLPAYLIADLQKQLAHQDPVYRLCSSVTPLVENQKISKMWGGGTMGDHARADFSRFTPEQISVIIDYLWWKLETEGYNPTIEQALENYWLERHESCNNSAT